jgi:hypothetical protein
VRPRGGSSPVMLDTVRRWVDWVFRSRRTGRLTVAQFPNASLAVFLVATALGSLVSLHGRVRTVTEVVARVSLVAWAGDEVIRGVNPFRRILGAAVLASLIFLSLR